MRFIGLVISAAVILSVTGREHLLAQEKTPPTSAVVPVSPTDSTLPPNLAARLYWQGFKQISAGTNAATFISACDLPESQRLEKQTLDRLSLAPWRLLHRHLDTNAAALLRPLCDDVVQQPCFLEIRQATNQSAEFAFAIQLSDQRAGFWLTNLAAVFESLTGIPVVPASERHYGWSLKKHHAPDFIELARVGGWVILEAGSGKTLPFNEFVSRLKKHEPPLPAASTHDWLQLDADLPALAQILSLASNPPEALPKISLFVTGEAKSVRTYGHLDFQRNLSLSPVAWNIPTNLIGGELDSFTAVRGFRSEVESCGWWKDLQIGPPPDQALSWSLSGFPMQTFFVAPLADASNAVARLTDYVLQTSSSWLPTNGLAGFKKSQTFNGLAWAGLPYISPFLLSVETNQSEYVLGGFFPLAPVVQQLPTELLHEIQGKTNLVYYSWELTGPRIKQWLFLCQTFRLVTQKAQLSPDAVAVKWLEALEPRLGNCATEITQTAPSQLSIVRKSPLGFTALELQLIADWLESPQFPRGLYSLLASPTAATPGPAPSAP